MIEEQEKLKQYLLGTSPERDAEQFDLRLIESEEFAAELSFAESELVEDFLEGNLSGDDLKLFSSNFLVSARRQELLSETAALKKEAVRRRRSFNAAPEMPDSAFVSLFRPLVGFAAVAVAVLIAVIIWQAPWAVRSTPLEAEYAAVNNRELSLPALSDKASLSLIPVTLRDSGSAASKKAADLTDAVLFRMALPAGEPDARPYTVDLMRGSVRAFSLREIRSYQNQQGREVRVLLPKAVLTPGRYQIRIESPDAKTQIGAYSFVIE